MSAEAFYPVRRILDCVSKALLRLWDSLLLVMQNIPQKKEDILVAQMSEFGAYLMVPGSHLQVSFLEHGLLEEAASSIGKFRYFRLY